MSDSGTIDLQRSVRLRRVFAELIDQADALLGCALVDVPTALPIALAVKSGSALTEDAMTLLSSASIGHLRGSAAVSGAGANSDSGESLLNEVREVQTTTNLTFHFASLLDSGSEALILAVDRHASTLGLGWMLMRKVRESVAALHNAPEPTTERAFGPRATPFKRPDASPPSQVLAASRRGRKRPTIRDLPSERT